MGWRAGSTPVSVTPLLRRQRVLWQEAHEPGASSEERGPTPAPPPAQQRPPTGEDASQPTVTVEFGQNSDRNPGVVSTALKCEGTTWFKAEALCSGPTGPRCCIARPCWPAAAPSWKPSWLHLKHLLAPQSSTSALPLRHTRELSHPPPLLPPSPPQRSAVNGELCSVRRTEKGQWGTAKGACN